jgi:hypothetical protein
MRIVLPFLALATLSAIFPCAAPSAMFPFVAQTDHRLTEDVFEKVLKAVEPTPEQRERLDQIWRTFNQEVENWFKQYGDTLRDVRKRQEDAITANDAGTFEAARAELDKIFALRRQARDNFLHQVEEVLKPEQAAKARQILMPSDDQKRLAVLLEYLNLKDVQKPVIKRIVDETVPSTQPGGGDQADKDLCMDLAFERIWETVLTNAQRRRFETILRELQQRAQLQQSMERMKLTPEQSAAVKAVLDAAQAEADKAQDPKQKWQILQRAQRKIRTEIWTDTQREEYHKIMAESQRQNMRLIGFTDEQITRAEAILDEARRKAQAAQNAQESREIMRQAADQVRREVMTEDQRQRLDAQRQSHP